MLSFFKSNNPGVVVFYLLYLIAFRVYLVISGTSIDFAFNYNEPLGKLIWDGINYLQQPLIPLLVLGAAMQFVQAIIVNRLVNENKMITRKTYLPGVVFIILSSFIPDALIFSPVSAALTFIMLAVSSLFGLTKKEKAYSEMYDVGFLSAVAALLYFPSVVLILFAYIGMGSLRPFRTREWTAALLGMATPFFLTFVVYYVAGTRPDYVLPEYLVKHLQFTPANWLRVGCILLWSFAALVLLPLVLHSTLIQVRKFTTLLTVLFVVLIFAFFLQQQINLSHLALVSFPISVITSMLLVQFKNALVSEVIHLILILLVLAGQYLPYFHIL